VIKTVFAYYNSFQTIDVYTFYSYTYNYVQALKIRLYPTYYTKLYHISINILKLMLIIF